MQADRWLRPQVRLMVLTVGVVVGTFWLLLAGFTAYAALRWPEHGILENTRVEWFRGMAMLSLIFAAPLVVRWLRIRRSAWRVGTGGIAVYHGGKLLRSYAWSDITSLHVSLFGATARSSQRRLGDEIPWLAAEDVAWLREYSTGWLQDRLVA